jgi:glucan biosynthesis protein C
MSCAPWVVAGLVVFHSAVVFATGTSWFVKDTRPGIGFTVFLLWGSLWGMPLLFLVSGMGARYAVRTARWQRLPGSGWPG